MNPSLFLELEDAVSAVEPRVLADYNPGLSDARIDAMMKDLPDDLRALYKWKNGCERVSWGRLSGWGFLGESWPMLPMRSPRDNSYWFPKAIVEEVARQTNSAFNPWNCLVLSDDGGGCAIFAERSALHPGCDIYYLGRTVDQLRLLMFRGVEPMLRTSLEWWRSGVFTRWDDEGYWELEADLEKYVAIGKRLNPDCDYWRLAQ